MIWCRATNQRSRISWTIVESIFIFDVVVGKVKEIPLVTVVSDNIAGLVPSDRWIGRASRESTWCIRAVVVGRGDGWERPSGVLSILIWFGKRETEIRRNGFASHHSRIGTRRGRK